MSDGGGVRWVREGDAVGAGGGGRDMVEDGRGVRDKNEVHMSTLAAHVLASHWKAPSRLRSLLILSKVYSG
jgi:hypothetical protein